MLRFFSGLIVFLIGVILGIWIRLLRSGLKFRDLLNGTIALISQTIVVPLFFAKRYFKNNKDVYIYYYVEQILDTEKDNSPARYQEELNKATIEWDNVISNKLAKEFRKNVIQNFDLYVDNIIDDIIKYYSHREYVSLKDMKLLLVQKSMIETLHLMLNDLINALHKK